jgi:hypothetical protein
MAINSAARRASVQAYTMGAMRPPPDGTVGEGDRATLTWLYHGIDYQAVSQWMDGVMTEGEWWRRRRILWRRMRNNQLDKPQTEIWAGAREVIDPKFDPK